MNEEKYEVYFDKTLMAENMCIDTALILISAIADKYYKQVEYGAEITIKAMPHSRNVEEATK